MNKLIDQKMNKGIEENLIIRSSSDLNYDDLLRKYQRTGQYWWNYNRANIDNFSNFR